MQFSLALVVVVLGTQSCQTLCHPMEFSRREYWSGLPFSFPGDLPYLGTELRVPTLHLGLPHCRQILYHCATWEAPFQPYFRIKIRVLTLRKRLLLSCPIFFPTSHFFAILRWMIWLYSFSLSLFFVFSKKKSIRIIISDIFIVLGECVISLVLSCTTEIWNSGPVLQLCYSSELYSVNKGQYTFEV